MVNSGYKYQTQIRIVLLTLISETMSTIHAAVLQHNILQRARMPVAQIRYLRQQSSLYYYMPPIQGYVETKFHSVF